MNRIAEQQAAWNASSREHWDLAGPHRQHVTRLLLESAAVERPRLCVFGAGNCNDLDLPRLAERFAEIHLVDLDGSAMEQAVDRQGFAGDDRVRCCGGCDVTGIVDRLAGWLPLRLPADAELDEAIRQAGAHELPLSPGAYDVVASLCLLSQLTESVATALGDRHPRFLELLQAVRLRHLRLLVERTRCGGSGLLATDVVSSESAPQLLAAGEQDLQQLLVALVAARNFFHGANPAVLLSLLAREEALAPHVERVECTRPWLWDFGTRHYAVVAIRFRRR